MISTRLRIAELAAAFCWLGVATPIAVRADARAIAAGQALSAPCVGCHGADGGGRADAGIPHLAGLDAGYLQAQLSAFASGSRANATMAPIAKAMDATAKANVAAYYASLAAPAPAASSAPATQVAAGATLADRGDWADRVPACASCHGKNGRGVGAAFPAIAGQSTAYVAAQLKAWKSGSRHGEPLGLMHAVAARLSDEQIAAVAAYYATLPGAAPAPGSTR